jgi:hypothetical protein
VKRGFHARIAVFVPPSCEAFFVSISVGINLCEDESGSEIFPRTFAGLRVPNIVFIISVERLGAVILGENFPQYRFPKQSWEISSAHIWGLYLALPLSLIGEILGALFYCGGGGRRVGLFRRAERSKVWAGSRGRLRGILARRLVVEFGLLSAGNGYYHPSNLSPEGQNSAVIAPRSLASSRAVRST